MAAEESIGKVASLCVRALLEFIGWLGVLAWRLASSLVAKIRTLLRERKEKEKLKKKGNQNG
jgi:cell division protein FtsB